MATFSVPTEPWALMTADQRSQVISTIATGTLAFGIIFVILRLVVLRSKSHDFSNRVVSVIHVFFAMALSTWSVADWKYPLANIGGPNSSKQMVTMLVSVSYFTYDFLCSFFESPIDWVMAVHHVFTILGFAYGIISGHCGTELVSCLWLMELSNPCMHARELIKELGAKDSAVATLNDILFAVTFTFARMVIGPYIVFATLTANSPIGVKLGATGIQLVSIFWFYKILRVVYYKVLKKGTKDRSREKKKD